MTTRPPADDEVRQLLVHPAVWPDLVAWLDRRGIDVGLMPPMEGGLPTYVMTPSDALIAATQADPVDTHDWHNPTGFGLRCRRCDLSHKLWSGGPCPVLR